MKNSVKKLFLHNDIVSANFLDGFGWISNVQIERKNDTWDDQVSSRAIYYTKKIGEIQVAGVFGIPIQSYRLEKIEDEK